MDCAHRWMYARSSNGDLILLCKRCAGWVNWSKEREAYNSEISESPSFSRLTGRAAIRYGGGDQYGGGVA